MKTEIYTIRDAKAEAFLPPIFSQNEAVCFRSIEDCLLDPDHQFTRHPQDYAVYHLGSFDDQTGKFDLHDAPLHRWSLEQFKMEK